MKRWIMASVAVAAGVLLVGVALGADAKQAKKAPVKPVPKKAVKAPAVVWVLGTVNVEEKMVGMRKSDDSETASFLVNGNTVITINGAAGKLEDLATGMQVKAKTQAANPDYLATLDVSSAGVPAAGEKKAVEKKAGKKGGDGGKKKGAKKEEAAAAEEKAAAPKAEEQADE